MGVAFHIEDGVLRAGIEGEIDHHNAKKLCIDIDKRIYTENPKTLLLDFGKVTFMDSSGLAVVAGRKQVCTAKGIDIYIVNISGYPEKILKMSGADRLVAIKEEKE